MDQLRELEFRLPASLLKNEELEVENSHLHHTKSRLESQAECLLKSHDHLRAKHQGLQSDADRLKVQVEVLESAKAQLESTIQRMNDELVLLRRAMFVRPFVGALHQS